MTVASIPDADVPEARLAGQPSQAEVESRPTFSAQATLERVEGNRDLLRRMVGLFDMQWRRLWAEVAKAGAYRDGPTLELTANKLKQSLASFGANQASRVAQELEELGHKCHFDQVEKNCTRLKMEIERLVTALKVFAKEDCE
jgi:HPt (histidine-containing phosphotransfer) domain-containing protein